VKTQSGTWILVANRSDAKLFEGTAKPQLIRAIKHAEGRLKSGAINSDRSGQAFQRMGTGASAMEKAQAPVEHEAERFAQHLAGMLHDEGARNAFAHLVLIAEPRFLGRLREALPRATLGLVERSFPSDIAGHEGEALRTEVERLLGAE
jgi:protein required for attachment to host cells